MQRVYKKSDKKATPSDGDRDVITACSYPIPKSRWLAGFPRHKRRAIVKALENASREGEEHGCAACGVSLASRPLPYLVGMHLGVPAAVCQACKDELKGTQISAVVCSANPPWIVSDNRWFEKHPTRRYRLREPIGQELAAAELGLAEGEIIAADAVIIVWQKDQKVRVRASVDPPPGPLSSFTEAGIAKILELSPRDDPEEFIEGNDVKAMNEEAFRVGLKRAGVWFETSNEPENR